MDPIYLDPPFNFNATYNVLYADSAGGAQTRAFNDTWAWDAAAGERLARFASATSLQPRSDPACCWPGGRPSAVSESA